MKHRVLLLVTAAMAVITTPGRSAVSLILECPQVANAFGKPVGPEGRLPKSHYLLEIDYSAQTVRQHVVDDDGAPYTIEGRATADVTYRAQIADNLIKWANPPVSYFTLGRYSGTLTDLTDYGGSLGWRTVLSQCHPYEPSRRRQF